MLYDTVPPSLLKIIYSSSNNELSNAYLLRQYLCDHFVDKIFQYFVYLHVNANVDLKVCEKIKLIYRDVTIVLQFFSIRR